MAKQTVNNGDSGLVARTSINENFTELYNFKDGTDATPIWYAEIASGTSGTVTAPTGGTLIEGGLPSGQDALCSTITTTLTPDFEAPTESDGTPVVISSYVAATGAFTLSGAPSAYPVSIIFPFTTSLGDYDNSKDLNYVVIDDNIFDGTLSGYVEDSSAITITTGAGTIDMATTENIRTVALIANTTITVSNLVANKALTLIFNTTGGPFTMDIDYGAKTIAVTMNGAAGAQNETLELLCDGTDLFAPTDGTVLWTVGV